MAGAEVLVVGGGGREEALRQAVEASSEVGRVVVSAKVEAGLDQFGGPTKPFVIIGPEAPLVNGTADDLRAQGYTVFGADRAAARYEADKAHTVIMMRRAGIPHPKTVISGDPHTDRRYVRDHDPLSYVIKANGLAGGKGVVLPDSKAEAFTTVEAMRKGAYDGAGKEIINFQKRHKGPEVSAMVVVGDNDEFTILPLSQDHKRLGEGDTGPNTGGMGAYAPLPESIVNAEQYGQIHEIVAETLAGMRADGTPYERAVLYAGLMMSEEHGSPVVIEYNVRFGDPETQVLMPLLLAAGVDVYRLLRSAAEGDLEAPHVDFADLSLAALTVCLAGEGYPVTKHKGERVHGLENTYDGVSVQLAATSEDGITGSGRELYVTGVGSDIDEAATRAYAAIDLDRIGAESGKIGFPGMQLRRDIGHWARTMA